MPRAAATPPTPDALPGLGPKSRDMLARIGIHTAAQLQAADPYLVYARLHASEPGISLNLLYGLIGAIENRPWQDVAREQRTEILLRLDALGIAPGKRRSPKKDRA
ncbi:TfoX/Sxy family DNA transformation protein [Viridibacterium curvum]|uniref:TfoX C-terminal domain-containing protein n=1 Tax=Viridibacterium curvum TaxID=1101404 RepID=A0ABP9QT44_9RHOO